jgi:hypothetical protein
VVHGSQAAAVGIACIAIGVFFHFHWFWSYHPALPFIGQVGKTATVVVFSACVLYVFFSFWVGP